MAISATTDWSKIRYVMLLVFATSVLLASTVATGFATSRKGGRRPAALPHEPPLNATWCLWLLLSVLIACLPTQKVEKPAIPNASSHRGFRPPQAYLNLSLKKFLLFCSHQFVDHMTRIIQKRQLFREHLLPQQGGKIPESAFRPDRLALNRLNQQGIYSSEGYYLEHRRPEVHFHPKLWTSETLKLTVRPDNRYVAPVGRYHFQSPHTVDTTYLIRQPTPIVPLVPFHRALPLAPHTSLKLLRHHLYHSNDIQDSPWNEVFPPNGFHEQIFAEFAPYLKKLHEFDYD